MTTAMRFALPIIATIVASLATGELALAQDLPPIVRAAIAVARQDCSGKAELRPGFVSTRDVNGDGRPDYVLDFNFFRCNGTADSCGSGGCSRQVFASMPQGEYEKVYDDLVRKAEFRKVCGRPAMILDVNGSSCGRAGADACGMTLFWNGRRFGPAN